MRKIVILFLFFLSIILFSACQNPGVDTTPTTPVAEAVPTDTAEPTATFSPTETSTPATIILYAPESAADGEVVELQSWLTNWASENGYTFLVKAQLTSADIPSGTRAVVLLNEVGVDVNAFAQQHPETTFVVQRKTANADVPGNVVVLVSDPNALHFAAGFVSILIAPDWRLGALLPWDDEGIGAETLEAFTNGSAFHCGRCASTYMPVALFPVTSSLSATSEPESWIEAITTLDNQYYLYTVYVAPEAASEALFQHLVTQNVTVVGEKQPENIEGLLWAASIDQDPVSALQEHWVEIINGTSEEKEIFVPIRLSEVNEDYLTPGRIRLYDEMMENLQEGWVSPLSPDYP